MEAGNGLLLAHSSSAVWQLFDPLSLSPLSPASGSGHKDLQIGHMPDLNLDECRSHRHSQNIGQNQNQNQGNATGAEDSKGLPMPMESSIQPSSSSSSFLSFATLNLNNHSSSSLSPFDINLSLSTVDVDVDVDGCPSAQLGVVDTEDINNNSGISFLTTLDPLVAEELAPTSSVSSDTPTANPGATPTVTSVNSYSSPLLQLQLQLQMNQGDHQKYKYPEIHFIQPTPQPRDGGDEQGIGAEEDEGIYFSIHDLDQYEDEASRNKSYLMEDLMSSCTPAPPSPSPPPPPLPLTEEDSKLVGVLNSNLNSKLLKMSRSNSLSNGSNNSSTVSFDNDHVDEDVDDYWGISSTSPSMDLKPNLKPLKTIDIGDLELVEGEGEKGELKCKFCGFVCCSKSSLGIHERRHTGERPYACKHCGRLFNSAQCCKHHERLHTGDKPFECQYCGKKYAVSTRLKRHERVHTREEPYKCGEPGCGKSFRWFDAFRDHRNTHNGVPLYLCSVCGKSFTSYLKFYYHERGHFLKRERDRDRLRKSLAVAAAGNSNLNLAVAVKSAPPKPKPKGKGKGKARGN